MRSNATAVFGQPVQAQNPRRRCGPRISGLAPLVRRTSPLNQTYSVTRKIRNQDKGLAQRKERANAPADVPPHTPANEPPGAPVGESPRSPAEEPPSVPADVSPAVTPFDPPTSYGVPLNTPLLPSSGMYSAAPSPTLANSLLSLLISCLALDLQ
ncbi:hypothetical protein L917_19016 [Phytophthora nicotianae]|uniref:Uncharacterized protein n=1 Tax=Phytophthora nicotianae TaxID=4792 RepID=W2K7G1_PHYNI|nr:hypothetical protein L917_19016 [Phytophthora nicotianae]